MAYKILFHPDIENDVNEIVEWYEMHQQFLGEKFLIELQITFKKITAHPLYYKELKKNYRRANLIVFPYQVVFKISKQTIIILMVFHQKRHPDIWKSRK